MKHASIIEQRRRREPAFDMPPQFTGVHDRRLGGRIVALWSDRCDADGRPADAFRAALDANWLAYIIWLDCGVGGVSVREVGAPVAATFGLGTGALSAETPFARALGLAALTSDHNGAPAQFEGGFARSPTEPVTLLTRGVVLPLTGAAGSTACAVITWTEPLPTVDSDLLRSELWLSMEMPSNTPRAPALDWTPAWMR